MKLTTRRHWLRQAALLPFVTCAATVTGVRAQGPAFPVRPLRLVAGGPGSVTDIRARWLAERLGAALGQPVVVENNPAAGGNLAAEQVARAAPDGHTLLITHLGIAAVNPHLYAKVGYDSLVDFAPVARFGIGQQALVVPAASPLSSVAELLARARAKPGATNYGSNGNGTPPHLAAEQLKRLAGIEATHVPYKGGGALLTALLGQQVDWAIEGLTPLLPHVKSGALRALAVSGSRRVSAWPEVPTLAEAGVPGYEYIGWTGIAAPAATPAAVVERLSREINRISTSEEGRRFFAQAGAEAGELSPGEFAAFVRAEHAKFGRLIRETGLRAE
ncbi:MAG: tripartite tricarboxylate transporter substrate binding protein [Betaproteobacteria bacterium]|nr:tripartite tricarboxylate transporter substrate binding protein [Betaproteobacteria bacterium]